MFVREKHTQTSNFRSFPPGREVVIPKRQAGVPTYFERDISLEEFMTFKQLALIITDKCTANCRICCLESNPCGKQKLSFNLACSCIEQASQVTGISSISFSGGEPFIFFDELLNLIQVSKSHKLKSSCVTNGFWATTKAIAKEKLSALKQAGLGAIKISYDEFHQEYVSPSNIAYIMAASKELGLFCQMQCVVTRSSSRLKDFLPLWGLDTLLIHFGEIPCLPVGRAKSHISQSEFIYRDTIPRYPCKWMDDLTILPNGDVYPCCTQGGFTTLLKLGSAKSETLAKLIQHFSENRLYQVLSSHGPSWFLNLFYDAGEESLFQRNYVNLCHLCHEIFSNPKAISLIQKNLVEETKLP